MWFSAEADLVTGIVVGAFGIDARFQVGARRQIPLAATPVLLAIHEGRRRLCGRPPCGHVALDIEHGGDLSLGCVRASILGALRNDRSTTVHRR
jgi:hypothetical protein